MEDLAETVIRGELGPEEKLLWAGRPPFGLVLRPADVFMIPFSLMWGGFTIFWEWAAIAQGPPWFLALWGAPLVLFGLYLIFGRFVVDARQRARTYYGVTNERVVIVSGLFTRRVKSLDLATLTDVTMTEKANGGGIITFGPTLGMHAWLMPAGWPGAGPDAAPCFELAEEVRRVYEIIRSANREVKQRV